MKLLFRIITLSLLLLLCSTSSYCQQWEWARKAGGEQDIIGSDIVVDASGNSYVVGHYYKDVTFYGNTDLGNITLTNSHFGSPDIFIAKYDPYGNIIWASKAGSPFYDSALGVAVDGDGNSYVTGTFVGRAVFGSIVLTTALGMYENDIFIAKYDTQGNVLWAKQASSTNKHGAIGTDQSNGIAVDSKGNSYITGSFLGSATFGSITLDTNGSTQAFIAKYDTHGQVVWARSSEAHPNTRTIGNGIATDVAGNCYVTGSHDGVTSFGDVTLTGYSENSNIFIVKYDTDGNLKWAIKAGGPGLEYGSNIQADAQGNCYLTGYLFETAHFDDFTITINNIHGKTEGHIFVAKYNTDGVAQWANLINATAGHDIAVNKAGESYIATNSIRVELQNDQYLIKNTGLVVHKFDTNGRPLWTKSASGESFGRKYYRIGDSFSIAIDNNDNSYLTGNFSNELSLKRPMFDRIGLTGNPYNMFVAKLNATAVEPVDNTIISLAPGSFCPGTEVTMHFRYNTAYPSKRTFYLQLSDASGSFVSPVTLAAGPESPLRAVIPSNLQAGNSYRIRVVADYAAFSVIGSEYTTGLTISGAVATPATTSAARCGAGSVTLGATGAVGNQSYRWYTTAVGGTAISSQTSSNFITPALSATTTYYVAVVNESGCESPRTAAIAFIYIAPTVVAGPDEIICGAPTSFAISGYGPAGGTWSGTGVSAVGIFNPSIAGPGRHVLTYTVTNGACAFSENKTIIVEPTIAVETGQELFICHESPAFTITDVLPAEGTWSGPGVTTTGLFNPSEAGIGTHTLTYSKKTQHCTFTGTKRITVVAPPVVRASAVTVQCDAYNQTSTSSLLRGIAPFMVSFNNDTKATDFIWEFGDGTTSETVNPDHQYNITGKYKVYLTVFYGNSCSSKQEIADIVVNNALLPNIFTPNGDGLNDTFAPQITCQQINLRVYNRYGNLVYEKENYQNTWDGGNVQNGVYYYHITTSTELNWKGWVTK